MTAPSPEPGKQAVVTGGAGFFGSHLCERLVAGGFALPAWTNFITGSPGNMSPLTASPLFTLINRDITEGLDVGGPVEYVFHLASPADYLYFPVQTLKAGSHPDPRHHQVRLPGPVHPPARRRPLTATTRYQPRP